MRDHVTEERISAYVDGELEGDELELVERLLVESAEYRQLLAELQELRASMQALPSFNLPADFHTRVVGQIDELAIPPAKELVARASRASKGRPWRRVFIAAASLAAVVVLTVMLRPPTSRPYIPDSPGIDPSPVELPIFMQQVPQYAMVYDVTVTPAGQKNDAVDKLLEKLGIGIDPALRLGDKLEKDLKAIRESQQVQGATESTPYKTDPATPKSTDKDKVEMIYVVGTLKALDQFGIGLEQLNSTGEEVSQLHYDIVIEPNKLGVMHRLHKSAREQFAQSSSIDPSDVGRAFRLSFHIELTSGSVPGAAMFRMPTIRADSALSGRDRDSASLDVNADGAISAADALGVMSQLNQASDEGNGDSNSAADEPDLPNLDEMQPGHILLILRNVGANAGDGK
ncbi:MAG: hypothetical protein O3C40_17185 [Planctomycetota bacterium]|nr:hypothetical protein [Planctomycetota bacterium]